MVLGLLVVSSIPVVTGVAEAVSEQKKQNAAMGDERYMTKFNLDIFCEANHPKAKEVHGTTVVMKDNKTGKPRQGESDAPPPHQFTGFYIQYPDDDRQPTRGLVSTISVDPPMLNWLYADSTTGALGFGNRSQSIEHTVGPWDWTEDQEGMTIGGEEAFVAVEEQPGVWAVYYDKDGDHLAGIPAVKNKTILEISLERNILAEERQGLDKPNNPTNNTVKSEGNMGTRWDK
ncbi:hypothetical protein P152DRAFT_463559 [Eremomyces bilateralis CBS 781.70]|uniref:Uncharacterized protein n=1 Tax=Eremomyces bilateralis CBS 781.70 TaxID=1392243 RepID=A0A6G1GH16_9PEZI|nr:uncharacterized protein P152DRAFT_463559 [Eremomyces bilateralis CBS 781.70]KAF1817395.1 hypothetical protein P152DRAFT_463559 [Eremomyces bilateralis CBS 781.70]